MQRLVSYHAVRDTTHLSLSWRAARDAPAHARDRARAHARTLDAARRRCSPAQVLTRHCKSRAHVHKSLRGTRGTRSPKDGTAPHSGPKGYGQLSSHGSRLPTAPNEGPNRATYEWSGLRPGMLYLDEVKFAKLT